KVYRVRYGEARQLAILLNDIFTGRQASGLDAATNQLAPGAGSTLSTSSALAPGSPGAQIGQQPPAQTRVGETGIGTAGTLQTGPGGRTGAALPGSSIFGQTGTPSLGGLGTGTGGPAILPGVRITADVANNSLLIYANQENYRIIEQTLLQLDRPQLQVAIDATIAEITLNDTLAYGVQYFLQNNSNSGSIALLNAGSKPVVTTAPAAAGTVVANTAINRVIPGFNFLVGSEQNPKVILNALRTVSDLKVLSAPSLVVLDNQVATLQVGDQVPITTQSATAVTAPGAPVVSNIDYRATGVILRVVPRINVNGNVLLDIEQEISNVADNANAGSLTPTISQRKVRSSIAVASGQTVLLAGLISETQNRSRSGIPVLEQLDWIGDAF